MSLALCFRQPQGQDRRPLPREGGGLRAGEGRSWEKQCLPENKTQERQKGSCSQRKESTLEKSIFHPRTLGCPRPGPRDPALNPTNTSRTAGVGILLPPKPPSQQQGFEFSPEQGKGRVHKARGVGASGSGSFGQERGRGSVGQGRSRPQPRSRLRAGRREEMQHLEIPTEISLFPCRRDYETTEAEFKYLQRNPAPRRDEGNKG